MKERFLTIPAVLRKQILIRLGGTSVGMIMLLIVIGYRGDWRFLIPCVALSLLCFSAAASLFDRCLQGGFVVIEGTCTEIEQMPLRRRVKAIYLYNDQYNIKLVGIRRIKNLAVGNKITIYVSDDTQVYEMDGYQVLCNYLAIEKGVKVQCGNLPEPID